MAINNTNQLLMRNIAGLAAENALFVNIEADEFITDYLQHYPQTTLSCYHTNFAHYQANKAINNNRLSCHFSVQYQSQSLHDLVVINFPKSKAELAFTLAMLAETVSDEASVIFVGENKGGIKSVEKLSKEYLSSCHKSDAARHCLLYVGQYHQEKAHFELAQWFKYYDIKQGEQTVKIAALPGVFSQNSLDVGSAILLENLPDNISGKVLDFGCGAGVIAASIGLQHPDCQLTLVDVSALALCSAEKTLTLNGLKGVLIATDSLSHVSGQYDFVVSNPPFHQGLKTHYAATEQFLANIKQHLSPTAKITIVANTFLKYPPIMEKTIGKTTRVCCQNGFAVYQSQQTHKTMAAKKKH